MFLRVGDWVHITPQYLFNMPQITFLGEFFFFFFLGPSCSDNLYFQSSSVLPEGRPLIHTEISTGCYSGFKWHDSSHHPSPPLIRIKHTLCS